LEPINGCPQRTGQKWPPGADGFLEKKKNKIPGPPNNAGTGGKKPGGILSKVKK